ncbi:hypothetical protein [Duganella vulcania]|uniref:Uncharacterized protein n=1 Tax=Duganella vulcania TaxID=2692166 RepID=A0A845GS37_9BURK|nr:hypothetical protein [Duganella vulcania]MYM96230.1 hypothetical protein [Duganella vulcania]
MRFNYMLGPDDRHLAEASMLGHLANVTLWSGTYDQVTALHFNLQFDDDWAEKAGDDKCHDAARVAIAHALEWHPAPGVIVDLFAEPTVARWPGRLDIVV